MVALLDSALRWSAKWVGTKGSFEERQNNVLKALERQARWELIGGSGPAESEPVPDADAVKVLAADNRLLRELLWMRHRCEFPALYGDDGESQCSQCGLDFKRDSPEHIQTTFACLGAKKLAADPRGVGAQPSDTIQLPSNDFFFQAEAARQAEREAENAMCVKTNHELARMQAELVKAKATIAEMERSAVCDGCGLLGPLDVIKQHVTACPPAMRGKFRCAHCDFRCDDMGQLHAHIDLCPVHPMAVLRAERDALRAEVLMLTSVEPQATIAALKAQLEPLERALDEVKDQREDLRVRLQASEAKLASALNAFVERDTAVRKREDMAKELTQALEKVIALQGLPNQVKANVESVWVWQGQNDQPESLACPVVMSAETCRKLVTPGFTAETLAIIRKGLHHTQDCLKGMSEGRLSADESFIDKTCACGLAAALAELNALEAK
ncbi:MAG: hypothetical protein WC986_14685 [Elusimicrobiota bacterium]